MALLAIPMTLPMSAMDEAPVSDTIASARSNFLFCQWLGEEFLDDRSLGFFIDRQVLAVLER